MISEGEVRSFLEQKSLSESSRNYYSCILRKLSDYARTKELSFDSVFEWLRAYANPSSRATAARVVKSYAKWKRNTIPPVGDENILRRFELERIMGIETEQVKPTITYKELSNGQLLRVFNSLRGLRFCTIWSLAWFGCRARELTSLRLSDIQGNRVTMLTEKTKEPRYLWGDDFTIKHLKAAIKGNIKYSQLYILCKRLNITPRLLRSTFITRMQRQLSGLKVVNPYLLVKYMAGHTVADITSIYTSYLEDTKLAMLKHHYLIPFEEKLRV